MVRPFFVWLHRWAGLLMAAFLIIEGLTGSLLAFRNSIEQFVTPQLYAAPRSTVAPLGLGALAAAGEAQEPLARIGYFAAEDRQVILHVQPRINPITQLPYDIDFDRIYLDPWTGRELGKRRDGDLSQGFLNLVPFIYRLHMNLAGGTLGELILGVVALAWTIDCFVGFYLTLPAAFGRFLVRWKPAWLIKRRASAIRMNYDLHRAGGLWALPLLFVLAWSSVMFNLREAVYEPVTSALFDYESGMDSFTSMMRRRHANLTPKLDWIAAQAAGERLMTQEAARRGLKVLRPYGMAYIESLGVYTYGVVSDADVQHHAWSTSLWLDGDSGDLVQMDVPSGEHAGNTVETWLRALHFADLWDSLLYRVTVCVLGLVIATVSITGIYIWIKKRRARLHVRLHAAAGIDHC
jgi:uncharacterized iron-regulated membrane protein